MSIFFLIALLLPQQIVIATPRGQVNIPVTNERDIAAVAAVLLARPLGLATSLDGSTVRATLDGSEFEFDIGSPFVRFGNSAYPLVGGPFVARDTLFLPLQWLSDYVPRLLPSRYRWDPWLARLDEVSVSAAAPVLAGPVIASPPASPGGGTPAPVVA
ncbi:MAG TPA: hypothetical protein VIG78_04240, partial [Gemmatimonadaceae bacterium]